MGIVDDLYAVNRLTKDVRDAGLEIGREEARELVDLYYRLQKERITLGNQSNALTKADRPHTVVDFVGDQFDVMERNMTSVLDKFSMSKDVGVWSRNQKGIGPIIAAGLLAHIDITKAPTVGHIWRFAGLDPSQVWLGKTKAEVLVRNLPNKDEETVKDAARANGLNSDTIWRLASTNKEGKSISVTAKSLQNAFARRPYNAELKVLCWKAGESFAKVQRFDDALYAHMYADRKRYELERDARGGNAETAARTLNEKKFTDAATKAIYESGHLPAGRLDLQAKRWAVKLFLSHWHHVAFVEEYGEAPPKPYILTQDHGHAHYIAPPS